MFFNKDSIFYHRVPLYRVKFVSFTNKNFSIKQAEYNYLADYEFLKLLETTVNANWDLEELEKVDHRHKLIILLDTFPEKLLALLKISNDLLYTFKSYFNDNKLDKLSKE